MKIRLLEQHNSKEFAPFYYSNNSLKVDIKDIATVFAIETRGQNSDVMDFDWDFVFELGNLQGTAKLNRREAKVKARRKLNRLKENEHFNTFSENKRGVSIKITPAQKKT